MKKYLCAASVALLSAAAQASPYAGIAVGASSVDIDCDGAATCDDSGTGFKLYGGWAFTPNIAGEIVYLNFGKARVADPGLSLDLKAHGIGGGVAFHVPFGQSWNFTARAGVASIRAKGDAALNGASGSVSDSTTKVYGGLGLGYSFAPNLSLNGEYDFSEAEIEGEKADVSMLTIGLRLKF